ncbi:MAG: N-glycosylase/DNA lyase [Endomicrobium sp.]|jgi:N-glycosylase/DNA lyase|nr:N-glycosylase/DNA lyase [Endomicrobium sp.]
MKNFLNDVNFLQTSKDNSSTIMELKTFWRKVLPLILCREKHFKCIFKKGTEKEIFTELIFCIFTPQSRAKLCWEAVKKLINKNIIFKSTTNDTNDIVKIIHNIRFKNNKAKYVVDAKERFIINGKIKIRERIEHFENNVYELREWLKINVKGIGYKEAGHFLRNIGISKNLAILDRHVLKNLKIYGVIKKIPNTLNKKGYFKIEKQMQKFSNKIGIPMSHLDMLFWCKNTGVIFK